MPCPPRILALISGPLLALAPACGGGEHPPTVRTCELEQPIYDRLQPRLDLLFVVDTTPSMDALEPVMSASIEQFAQVLETLEGGAPDLHIAVVSSDLGAGGLEIAGCSGDGDGGRFLTEPRVAGCQVPADGFLRDLARPWFQCQDPLDCRERNVEGSLADALRCMTPVSGGSCAIAQPLAAMQRALDGSHPGNAGFLRQDAFLAVVFLTDGDDCSAMDPALFEPDPTTGRWPAFRCAEHAIACAGEPLDGTAGTYADCQPRADGGLVPLDSYAAFLRSLHVAPGAVIVSGAFGQVMDGVVTVGEGSASEPVLEPACDNGVQSAEPGVRLNGFLERFPQRHTKVSACASAGYAEVLLLIAERLHRSVGEVCYAGLAAEDIDEQAIGLQVACTVADVSGNASAPEVPIRPCLMLDERRPHPDTPLPCYWAFENDRGDPTCPVSMRVERDQPPAPGVTAMVRCEIDCRFPE